MLIRFLYLFCLVLSLHVSAEEKTIVPPVDPEILNHARTIVGGLVRDKQPEDILAMVNEIALALSDANLCGVEDILAMTEVGIPFETAYEAIIKSCNIQGAELAALNRSFAPGLTAKGGPGPEVSP